ncbi:hypothetical protein LCGC14_3164780, partial [marine sediment metagenome]
SLRQRQALPQGERYGEGVESGPSNMGVVTRDIIESCGWE